MGWGVAVADDILLTILSFQSADYARIQTDGAQSSEEPRVFNFNATIHHHFETRFPGPAGGRFVDHAQLHPDHFHSTFDGLFDDIGNSRRLAKNIHNLDWPGHVAQRRVTGFSQYLSFARIYRGDVITVRDHINRGEMAGTEWIRGKPHHGNPL